MSEKLKPCPFCGEDAEMDTQQGYRPLSGGPIGSRVAIYCTHCTADMGYCREDFPELDLDQIIEVMTDDWNTRAVNTPDHQEDVCPADTK